MSAPDDDDFKKRNEQLARDLLDELRKPGVDPERAAYDARKDVEDKAALEDYYRRTGQTRDTTPRARNVFEMQFAASLVPCPHCGSTEPVQLDASGGGDLWSLRGPCPRCRQQRTHTFATEGRPLGHKLPRGHLGDARPSQVIRVGQFMAEYDRVIPRVRERPEELEPLAWRAGTEALDRAITCVTELLKFVPAGTKIIPDTLLTDDERRDRAARRERYTQAWLQGELDRLRALYDRYVADAPRIWALEKKGRTGPPPQGAIDRDALRAHADWVQRGRTGAGRLEVVGYDARGLGLGGAQFADALLERVILDRANLNSARMQGATLRDVSVREANCTSIQLHGATLVRGTFERSALALASFDGAVIDETSFRDSNLDRSAWTGARVTAASFELATFGNARIQDVRFRGCTFTNADFRPMTAGFDAPTAGALFEDCDLRGTRWAGRDVSNATFVRCKFGGASGTPAAMTNVTIEDPDLSAAGDGSDLGEAEDVRELWGVPVA